MSGFSIFRNTSVAAVSIRMLHVASTRTFLYILSEKITG